MLSFLLTLVEESDRDKVERLYNKHHKNMLKYAITKLRNMKSNDVQHDAEDAVQNAFIKIVKYFKSIDFSRSEQEITCYVYSILANEIYDLVKKSNKTAPLYDREFDGVGILNPARLVELQEDYDKLVKAIEDMDEIYSTAMFMSLVLDLSVDEIANIIGAEKKTVYTRLERGQKLLRKAVKGVE